MIVATEARRIPWSEVSPALESAYRNGYAYAEELESSHEHLPWTVRSGLSDFLRSTPLTSRLVPGYFWCRGVYDGLAGTLNDDHVELIVAAWFSDDADKVAPQEVERFIADKFPEKRQR